MASNTPDTYNRANPRHRIMVEYAAYGKDAPEIADATGYSEMYVRGILRSPLFQTEVAQAQDEIKREGLKRFADALADQAMPSLMTLTTIRDNTQARDTDRVSAADKVIGRALDLYAPRNGGKDGDGKRTMKLVIEGGDLTELVKAIRDVDAPQMIDASAAVDDVPVDEPERARPLTIDEMIALDEQETV